MIIDAHFTLEEVLKQRQEFPAPKTVLERQRIVEVFYFSFDGKPHRGQIVVDKEITREVKEAFELILNMKFPITSVIPLVDRRFMYDDEKADSLNNSSGFNYRIIAKSNKLSNHAFGRAIDINPKLNPFIKGNFRIPEGAVYNPDLPGTIVAGSKIVEYFKGNGWRWGGDWTDRKDFMHFDKPLA